MNTPDWFPETKPIDKPTAEPFSVFTTTWTMADLKAKIRAYPPTRSASYQQKPAK